MKNQLLAWAAIGVILTGCSSKTSQFESQFIDGCVGPDGSSEQKKICSCVVDKLEAHHSVDELFTLAQQQPQKLLLEAASYAPGCGARK